VDARARAPDPGRAQAAAVRADAPRRARGPGPRRAERRGALARTDAAPSDRGSPGRAPGQARPGCLRTHRGHMHRDGLAHRAAPHQDAPRRIAQGAVLGRAHPRRDQGSARDAIARGRAPRHRFRRALGRDVGSGARRRPLDGAASRALAPRPDVVRARARGRVARQAQGRRVRGCARRAASRPVVVGPQERAGRAGRAGRAVEGRPPPHPDERRPLRARQRGRGLSAMGVVPIPQRETA
jgi:hypothetical protein